MSNMSLAIQMAVVSCSARIASVLLLHVDRHEAECCLHLGRTSRLSSTVPEHRDVWATDFCRSAKHAKLLGYIDRGTTLSASTPCHRDKKDTDQAAE